MTARPEKPRVAHRSADPATPEHQTLSQRLRAETKDAHTVAERSGIMRSIVRGVVTRPAYVALLRNLADIYRALEEELARNATHPGLSWLDLEPLRRLDRLEADIAALQHDGDVQQASTPSTQEYVTRLRRIGADSPGLLVAHAYVRYMGDLSGGQILGPIVTRALGVKPGVGTSFYDFPSIDDPNAFKAHFRDGIDGSAAHLSVEEIVAEALLGFALHERIFNELEPE